MKPSDADKTKARELWNGSHSMPEAAAGSRRENGIKTIAQALADARADGIRQAAKVKLDAALNIYQDDLVRDRIMALLDDKKET